MNYFSDSEMMCPCCKRNGAKKSTVKMLNEARESAGIPFEVNSFFRCEKHNKAVGGSPTSSHLKGYAVDVRVPNSSARFKTIKSLLGAGFTRLGIYKTFIHADNDPDKPAGIVWTGL